MVEDGFRTGEQHIVEAGYLRHSRARPDIPSFLRRLADPVRHEFEKIPEAGGQHGLLVERGGRHQIRSEEHTSELQSLMCPSYAVFSLKKKNLKPTSYTQHTMNTLKHISNITH